MIKGSFKDLVDGISKSPDAQETYLVVLKTEVDDAMSLDFYEYDITQENWFEWVGVPRIKNVPTYEEKEFEFGTEDTPKIIMDNLGKDPVVGKIVDGEFKKRPTETQSVTKTGNVTGRRKVYDELSEEEITVVKPMAILVKVPYELRNEAGETPALLITGRKYKVNVINGTKRVVDYAISANFKELYKDFLKPGAFKGLYNLCW